nr:class I SAM-dependent methyltransferase [Anaerolineae bacterium]
LDISLSYVGEYMQYHPRGVVASAADLPFHSDAFDGVWSIGLIHHLTNEQAGSTFREMLRVCRPGGYVALLDAVLPTSFFRRPVAWVIRRMDRGGQMRTQEHLIRLLPSSAGWNIERVTYAATGLEMLVVWTQKPA